MGNDSPAFPLSMLSQSSLQDYSDCPRRFQLRYPQRLAWPAVESEPALENERRQQEGLLFHRLVHQHLLGLPAEKVGRLASGPNLSRWWEHYLADAHLQRLRSGAILYPEVTLSAPLGGVRLLAQYDLIARQERALLIYDWKTYRHRPHNEWLAARWQTRLYRALLVQAGASLLEGAAPEAEQIEMVYWFADYPNEPARFAYSTAQFQRDWSALQTLVAEILSASDFPKTDDERDCLYCVYRSYCERGVAAGEGEGSEAEGPAWDFDFEQIQEIVF